MACITRDHDKIRRWVEDRKGRPAVVEVGGEGGILRIDFEGKDQNLEEVDWNNFFAIFDDRNLVFLYEDVNDSRFNKFIHEQKE